MVYKVLHDLSLTFFHCIHVQHFLEKLESTELCRVNVYLGLSSILKVISNTWGVLVYYYLHSIVSQEMPWLNTSPRKGHPR